MSAQTIRPAGARRAPRELVLLFGRAVLWLVVAVVLLCGVTATLASRQTAELPRAAATAPSWPDDAARAFATEFATAYLTQPPADTAGLATSGLAEFVVPELADQLTPRPDPKGRP